MASTILVVNVSKAFGRVLERFFQDRGFEVLVAKDAIEAFRIFIMHPVDLVLTDYELPNISGRDLVETFRTNKEHKHLPIVVFSGSPGKGLIQECTEAGASAVLDKSMDHDELIEKIRKLVDEYQDSVHKIGFDKDLSLSTVKATREVMSTMMGMEVEAGQVRFEKIAPRSAEVIGSVGVAGVLSGSITIFLDMELAKTVTANMLMMDPGEIEGDEEIVDAIGETANMIAGNIKTHLFDKVPLFDIATPSVTIGRDVRRTTIANRFGMIAPFLHEGREFHVEFLLVEREGTEEKGVSLNILTQEQAPAE